MTWSSPLRNGFILFFYTLDVMVWFVALGGVAAWHSKCDHSDEPGACEEIYVHLCWWAASFQALVLFYLFATIRLLPGGRGLGFANASDGAVGVANFTSHLSLLSMVSVVLMLGINDALWARESADGSLRASIRVFAGGSIASVCINIVLILWIAEDHGKPFDSDTDRLREIGQKIGRNGGAGRTGGGATSDGPGGRGFSAPGSVQHNAACNGAFDATQTAWGRAPTGGLRAARAWDPELGEGPRLAAAASPRDANAASPLPSLSPTQLSSPTPFAKPQTASAFALPPRTAMPPSTSSASSPQPSAFAAASLSASPFQPPPSEPRKSTTASPLPSPARWLPRPLWPRPNASAEGADGTQAEVMLAAEKTRSDDVVDAEITVSGHEDLAALA